MSIKPEVTFIEPNKVLFNSGQSISNVHSSELCSDRACPIHDPSEHAFRGFPLYFNGRHMVRVVERELFVDPDDYYFALYGKAILRNSATCLVCGDMIVSKDQHDMKYCSCGKAFVDGGAFYLRRGGDFDSVIDTSVVVIKEPNSL